MNSASAVPAEVKPYKRTSGEMLGLSSNPLGGAAPGMLYPTENNNEAKKPRVDGSNGSPTGQPQTNGNVSPDHGSGGGSNGSNSGSRVVHIRNIPHEVSEAEVIHLGIPFGRITNVLVLKGKNQAFLEFEVETFAHAMVNYFGSCVAQLRGRTVYVQFSNHKELKTDQTHSNANQSSRAALQAAQAFTPTGPGGSPLAGNMGPVSGMGNSHAGATDTQGGPNTVLRVIVEHMLYPVTLDVLHQIFSRVGRVMKIITFTKNNTFQALIQYPDVISAQAAKLTLDGQNIYNACCTLRIEYSKLSNLNVRFNNDKSRDYTNPQLPPGESGDRSSSPHKPFPHIIDPNSGFAKGPFSQQGGMPQSMSMGGGGPPLYTTPAAATHYPHPLGLLPHGGDPSRLMMGGPNGGDVTANLSNTLSAMNMVGMPLTLPTALSVATALGLPTPQGGMQAVLLVSNLSEEEANPEGLFTLFGVYGDVQRVKILYNKKDSALIQMSDHNQAQLAITHLDRMTVWGKQLRVGLSKHQQVQMPKEGQAEDLTKDFSNNALHRFKRPGSKNFQNIHGPSSTLHLSNIPPTTTEEQLMEAFKENGFTVKAFKFFPNDHRMALIQLDSVEDAIMGLIKMHNFQLDQRYHLRVSFSKSTIS